MVRRCALIGILMTVSMSSSANKDLTPAAAFREACNLSRYNCKGIPAPMVRESIFVRKDKALGVHYWGRNTIWLAPGLPPDLRYVILVHESVHYLQSKIDMPEIAGSDIYELCMREEEAYEASDQVARRLGIEKMIRLDMLREKCGEPPAPVIPGQSPRAGLLPP